MTEASDIPQRRPLARIGAFVAERRGLVRDYFSAISGAGGRLVFSLAYFIALANTLSIAEFGMFATASAAGVMLSRLLAFGFISALYRTATIRPNLIGTFTAGFLLLGIVSLPLLAAASYIVYLIFFASTVPLPVFAATVFAEALLWRPVEVALIVNNGLGKFGRAAVLAILATALRAAGAVLFMFCAQHSVWVWSWFYIGANAASLLIAFGLFYPRQRLRLRGELYLRRLADSIYVAGAEVLFYLQMEFDKLLVLAIGGPHLAGIYAIIMRLVDLTAIPIRTFSMMLVQRMMRAPELLSRLAVKSGIEGGVFAVSTLALLVLAVVLHFFPGALGKNVSEAAPLVALAIGVPGLRNLVEYQAELLFARGQTLVRALNLGLLAALKALLLTYVLTTIADTSKLVLSLNVVFLLLYLASMLLTYSALRKPAKAI
ncbi:MULTISPECIES: lipopolysaccharide biosynthesis protein [unclassified Mesorhizobium]|uniref:lipopolysaccharide biosynthesis protein n=1 Tax=unclassified Mesorhizobium TaxID=325217 RepID=UPI00112D96FE|nr:MULTISPECIES: lipopolysaccharide biosynthesis protein [unclassified Mesorhizobium]MCA0028355.1 lipopolysaccharide biosynthesis protein [Mesorhizobium sp. B263B1A]TPJ85276.1 lipopolysaccharide biosynthesis protein [Mesorhizobium sp. B2-5-12]TPK18497.1 lipopolysaccharide biosynthesis protein [Mesorhizobium sp. B2-5-6]TPM12699.1 lipopolysaccharide biosynthesis protein [Mesorhizobium sp. B2-3-6]TPN40319.1 lipopolysaccharide biosynthesis protein [Mesorhizobium sp. B1-1-6]